MANDDVDLKPLLDRCEHSLRYLSHSVKLAGEQYLLGARNALADPSGEDREEAIRFLLLFHEHWTKHVGGDFRYRTPADPPALQAVRELRRRMQRDKRTRRRRAAWLGWATLGVAVVGAIFSVMSYFKALAPATPPPIAPGLEQPAPRPPSVAPMPSAPAPSVQPPPAVPR